MHRDNTGLSLQDHLHRLTAQIDAENRKVFAAEASKRPAPPVADPGANPEQLARDHERLRQLRQLERTGRLTPIQKLEISNLALVTPEPAKPSEAVVVGDKAKALRAALDVLPLDHPGYDALLSAALDAELAVERAGNG